MKICLVTTGLGMGGAERQICDLADQFYTMGHAVKIISLNEDAVVLPSNKNVIVKNLYLKKTIFGLLDGFLKLRKEIIDFNPDVVHSHMIHANIMCRVLRIITPINKLICTAHNTNEGEGIRSIIFKYTDFLATITTNVSQEAVDIYIKNKLTPRNKIIYQPNGIDENKFFFDSIAGCDLRKSLFLENEDFLFLAVGRLENQKDYFNLVRAFKNLQSLESKRVKLAIIGDGYLKEKLNQLVIDLKLDKDILFLGKKFNVEKWMSACDAYVLSSAWEGLPLVVLESMLCERVVVATDCGGVKELINEIGFLVPPKDATALSEAMNRAMSLSLDERKALGKKAREQIINNYSLSAIANKWIDIYNKY